MRTSARFAGTRAAHRHERVEDYVEAIEQLCRGLGTARVRDVAAFMGVSSVTVCKMAVRLTADGLVQQERYGPLRLTGAGRRLARKVEDRHAVVLAFLRSLGVPAWQAELDAEGIEHHVSAATIAAMRRSLGRKNDGRVQGKRAARAKGKNEGKRS
ncbi:MAG: iron dependent repressor, metal binding and dimerization domain protein [bacterium]|nr:transcriptional regulator [Phycisphaerales bacterium]MCE2653437.1 transcriptional regulator [Planctomycetaceae bacterium]